MLQNTNKRLQEYTTLVWSSTIATYNQMHQRITKLQNQKNTMVETINGLKVTVTWKNCSQIWQRYVRSLFNLCTTLSVETFIYANNKLDKKMLNDKNIGGLRTLL
jgi:hypothetical protein